MSAEIDLGAYRQWATHDLLEPTERGRIAEYMVGSALGCLGDGRRPGRPYHFETGYGCRIDVRSSSRVQSWGERTVHRRNAATVLFNIAGASPWWDRATGRYVEGTRSRWSDVHVCALLDHTDRATANPASPDQWRFWVLPTHTVTAHLGLNRSTASTARLERLGAVVGSWVELPELVRATWHALNADGTGQHRAAG